MSGGRRNWLDGGAGEDEIQGGSRSDTIIGGTWDDTLSGGAGADRFTFGSEFGRDTITDFGRSEDVLVFEASPTRTETASPTSSISSR